MSRASLQARWSKAIRKRDGYVCDICHATTELTAHHLNSKDSNQRYSKANGICLCATCHKRFHQSHSHIHGNRVKHCTAAEYYQFKDKSLEKRARSEGKDAFHKDLTRCDNPYPSYSIGYEYWDRAFRFEVRQYTSFRGYKEYIL